MARYPIVDTVLSVCTCGDDILIGRYVDNYPICPSDWDLLAKRLNGERGPEISELARSLPERYTGSKTRRVPVGMLSFEWDDAESGVTWHFIPYHIEATEPRADVLAPTKYAEFLWIPRKDVRKYSRDGYLEHVLDRTIGW